MVLETVRSLDAQNPRELRDLAQSLDDMQSMVCRRARAKQSTKANVLRRITRRLENDWWCKRAKQLKFWRANLTTEEFTTI